MNMRHLLIAGAAAFALGLAGCGGNGDDTAEAPVMEMPEPMPDPKPMPTVIELPAGNVVHRYISGDSPDTMTVHAGTSRVFGGLQWTCPADGPDCIVQFTDDILSASAMAPPGAGVAMVGPVPNPAFGGSDLAGYLSNENVLMALRGAAAGPMQGRGFDITGDGYGDTSVRRNADDSDNIELTNFGEGDDAIQGVALSARGGISLDLYSTILVDDMEAFNKVYGDNVTPTSYAGVLGEADDPRRQHSYGLRRHAVYPRQHPRWRRDVRWRSR